MERYVLVADDQPKIRYLMLLALEKSGYQVKLAEDGCECVEMVRSGSKPSLILLDHQMPRMTGMEVLAALKRDASTRGIPVILISAAKDIKEEALSNGASAVMTKPLDVDLLIETVQKLLGKGLLYSELIPQSHLLDQSQESQGGRG